MVEVLIDDNYRELRYYSEDEQKYLGHVIKALPKLSHLDIYESFGMSEYYFIQNVVHLNSLGESFFDDYGKIGYEGLKDVERKLIPKEEHHEMDCEH